MVITKSIPHKVDPTVKGVFFMGEQIPSPLPSENWMAWAGALADLNALSGDRLGAHHILRIARARIGLAAPWLALKAPIGP